MALTYKTDDYIWGMAVASARVRVRSKGGWELDFDFNNQTQAGVVAKGLMGEWAYAVHWKVEPDMRLLASGKGDDGVDLVVGDHHIDVKSTPYRTGRLLLNDLPSLSSKVTDFALATIDRFQVRLAGVISKTDFLAEHEVGDFNNGLRFYVNQDQLRPPSNIANPAPLGHWRLKLLDPHFTLQEDA